MRVALDVDGTLAQSYEQMIAQWNREKNTNFTINDATTDNFGRIIGMTPEDFRRHYNAAWTENWREISASATAGEMRRFMASMEVDLVTSRPPETLEGLNNWLSLKFPGIKFNIVISGPKAKFGLDYDVYIEDGDTLAEAFVENAGKTKKRLLLVSAFCNRERDYERYEGITRVESLSEAIGLLLSDSTARSPRAEGAGPKARQAR